MDSSQPQPTEVELLRQTAAGNAEAFGQLYDRTARVLFAVARQILRDEAATEDLLQDVYLQVWNKAGAFNASMGRPLTWLITLTRNRAIDRLRSSRRFERLLEAAQGEMDAFLAGDAIAPGTEADPGQSRLIRVALDALPSEQRQAIELAFFAGLTQTEIATKLSAPLGTIKARIRRGMLQLRDALKTLQATNG